MATYQTAALASPAFAPANPAPAARVPVAPQARKPASDGARRDAVRRVALPDQHATYQQGLLSRLIGYVIVARQRAAEREIARYLATTGGKMTDSIEREIQRRLI